MIVDIYNSHKYQNCYKSYYLNYFPHFFLPSFNSLLGVANSFISSSNEASTIIFSLYFGFIFCFLFFALDVLRGCFWSLFFAVAIHLSYRYSHSNPPAESLLPLNTLDMLCFFIPVAISASTIDGYVAITLPFCIWRIGVFFPGTPIVTDGI